MTPWREVLWDRREIVETRIGGHSFVQPNAPGKVAYMTPRYSGDFDQIAQAAENYGGAVCWGGQGGDSARPTSKEMDGAVPGGGGSVDAHRSIIRCCRAVALRTIAL